MKKLILVGALVCFICSCNAPQTAKESETKIHSLQPNKAWRWVLVVPENTPACELSFCFPKEGQLQLSYRGIVAEGTYTVDAELPQYVYISIPTRFNRANDCAITPEYLSLYTDRSDFAVTQTDEFLYLQRMDKVLKFRKEIIS